MCAANRSYGQRRRARRRAEIQHVAAKKGGRKYLCYFAHALLLLLVHGIALQALVPNDIQHVVLLGNVPVRIRHHAVNHFTEQIQIPLGVGLDRDEQRASDKLSRCGAIL